MKKKLLPMQKLNIFLYAFLTIAMCLSSLDAFCGQGESAVKILSERRSMAKEYHPQIKTTNSSNSTQKSSDAQEKKAKVPPKKSGNKLLQTTVEGVRFELKGCAAQPEQKSITCNMTLTNLEHDADVVLYCYSGTSATDNAGNNLQCGQASIASNNAWNYAFDKLVKDVPAKAMVRLDAENKSSALSELNFKRVQNKTNTLSKVSISFSVNGLRKVLIFQNIPVGL